MVLGGGEFRIEQAMRFNYKFSVTITRNTGNNATSNVSTESYNAGIGLEYNFAKNIRMNFDFTYNVFNDRLKIGSNYQSYNALVKVNATF